MNKKNILVCGIGNFGYAILNHLDKNINNNTYNIYGRDKNIELIKNLKIKRKHNKFHKQYTISKRIIFSKNIKNLISNADIIVLCISSNAITSFVKTIVGYIKKDVIILNTAKALSENGIPFSIEISNILKGKKYEYGVISGGTIAKDLFFGYPLGATVAFKNRKAANLIKKIFCCDILDIEISKDLIGTEYAGIFKNIGSIIAGYLYGGGYPYGTETYYLTNFSREIKKLVSKYLGGKKSTFNLESHCRGNDFWMSSTGGTRNREFGILLGKGIKYKSAIKIMKLQNKTIEGSNTIEYLEKFFKKNKIDQKEFKLLSKAINLKKNKALLG